MKHVIVAGLSLALMACSTSKPLPTPEKTEKWVSPIHSDITYTDANNLKQWWTHFEDPILNELIEKMLANNPDRNIARARIEEARGIRRSTRSFLFPQIGGNANINREEFGFVGPENFSDARFDASFEIDIFGKNKNNLRAEDARILSLRNEFYDTTVSLIAEITRTYIDYRGFAKQEFIAQKNLKSQQQTLDLIRTQKILGEATSLDEERSKNLVNTTKASIPEFRRLTNNAKLQLSVLTGEQPHALLSLLSATKDIPQLTAKPLLLTPSQALTMRPDIQAASANLSANTSLTRSATAELWPSFTLSGFFGETEGAFTSPSTVWNITLGTAVNLIDFGRIEGRIDAAKAREKIAYEQYRRVIIEAITEVETALNDYTYIDTQRASLERAYNNAKKALELSQNLYQEGEISFLDILDAQRTVNEADSALVTSEIAKAESIISLYKSLGVY